MEKRTTKYVFHSEKTKTTCNECLKHDGEIYYDIKDIPELPLHPNCKCWVETIELAASKGTKCDCANRFKVLENNLANLIKNSDLMLDSIKDNIIEIEEEIEEKSKEKIKNRFYLIENRIKDFKKECKNLYIDIGLTKEFSFNSTYHTIEECKANKQLEIHSKNVSKLCEKINTLSEDLKRLKEDKNNLVKKTKEEKKKEEENVKQGTITGGAANVNEVKNRQEFEKSVDDWRFKINLSRIPVFGKIGVSGIEIFKGGAPDAAGMINISEGKEVYFYTKDAIKTVNIGDSIFEEFKNGNLKKWIPYMQYKIQKQFEDFGYKMGDVKGYIFKNNSALSRRIKNSKEFKEQLILHKNEIQNGERYSDGFKKNNNLSKAYGKYDVLNGGFDKNGNLHLYLFDTYDFNEGEGPLIEAGRREMLKGNLKGFFSVCEIIIKKENLKKYGL